MILAKLVLSYGLALAPKPLYQVKTSCDVIIKAKEPDLAKPPKRQRLQKETVDEDLLEKYPWLPAAMTPNRPNSAAKNEDSSDAEPAAATAQPAGPQDMFSKDEQYDALFAELEEMRRAIRDDVDAQTELFRTALLGGEWQKERTGRSIYGIRADVRSASKADQFCATLYGEAVGAMLAKFWMHRMGFLVDCWERASQPANDFPRNALEAYQAPADIEAKWSTFEGRVKKEPKLFGNWPLV